MLIPDYLFIGTVLLLLLIPLIHILAEKYNYAFHPSISIIALAGLFILGVSFLFCDVVYVYNGNKKFKQYYSWGDDKDYPAFNMHTFNDSIGNIVILNDTPTENTGEEE